MSSYEFDADTWYRVEVDWDEDGSLAARLFGNDGETLLTSVSATSTDHASGGGITFGGSDGMQKVGFDTVQVVVPEPTTGLLGLGMLGVLAMRRGRPCR